MFTVHVVAHTHWDREWYHPHVRFRQRLVPLVDELLDDPPTPPSSFLLDGQAIVLEDYLAVRPERAAELSALLHDGRLEAGPWYVLADELIPSAEALVRNLLIGRRVLRGLRAEPPPVLYCPDSFGHPAALPTLAAGFGLPLVVLWRGLGERRTPNVDVLRWHGPDASTAIVFHLPRSGYEYGSQLPTDESAARERWRRMRAELGARARVDVMLVQNGADHHARQRGYRAAVDALAGAARETGDALESSSLTAFARDLMSRVASATLPDIAGELRDSYGYTWTLQGTLASRAYQKRRNALVERALVRDAEPWAALARRRGGVSHTSVLVAAWKTLLQSHPHDTLCGCSIDGVAAAMDLRLDDAVVQARGIRDDAVEALLGHDADAARGAAHRWRPVLVVRNRSARPRGGVAVVEVRQFLADEPVGPGSGSVRVATSSTDKAPPPAAGVPLQILRQFTDVDRVESARHYPDNDLVAVTRAAIWLDAVPSYGISTLPLGKRSLVSEPPRPVRVHGSALDNTLVRVAVDATGRVSMEQTGTARRVENVFAIEDLEDCGDLYTPSVRGPASRVEFSGCRIVHSGPIVGELVLEWRLLDQPGSVHKPRQRGTLTLRLRLVAGAPWLGIAVRGWNVANDHRLRLAVRTDVTHGEVWADAAFGAVRRERIVVDPDDRLMETPPPTAPLHRYVSRFTGERGATLYSDGLAEYEAGESGEIWVTLLRAVGQLSRNDLPERPGHAGWPASTPAAQSHGRFAANLALFLHGSRTSEVIDSIERTADDVLLPLDGRTLRSAIDVPANVQGVELRGAGLGFAAFKDAETGDRAVLRCVNLLDTPTEGSWHFGFPIREAALARLDESAIESLAVRDNGVSFRAPARGVVTILVR